MQPARIHFKTPIYDTWRWILSSAMAYRTFVVRQRGATLFSLLSCRM